MALRPQFHPQEAEVLDKVPTSQFCGQKLFARWRRGEQRKALRVRSTILTSSRIWLLPCHLHEVFCGSKDSILTA